MQRSLTLTAFILLIVLNNLFAQKQANNWALGDYQLVFNGSNVQVKSEFANYLNRGLGIISDENGALILYTDGFSVWNKHHQLMQNGAELLPTTGVTSTQESIVIPGPGSANIYYIFTVDPWNGQETSGLYYSVVDLSANNGMGAVTAKGNKILENTTNKISAAFHENGRDVWLLTHKHSTNNYYSFLISPEGVSDAPVLSQVGKAHDFWSGQLKFSTDGKKAACSRGYDYSDKTSLDLFDFDPSTGILSNAMSFALPADRDCEGVEFSSDSRKLYVAQMGSTWESGLYQFDLSLTSQQDIRESMTLLHKEHFNGFRQLQLAPDGNIYITKGGGGGGTAHLGVISNVNAGAADVLVEENGLYLQGGSSFVNNTPNFIQNFFFQTSFSIENTCQSKPTQFTITNTYLLDSVEWTFGEGSASTNMNPAFTYEEAGTYSVVLTAHYPNRTDIITKEVKINPFPILELGPDITKCYGAKLSAGDVFSSYHWQNGDTTSATTVRESGYYTLQVTNEYGCTSKDSVYVDVIELPQVVLPDTILFTQDLPVTINPGNFASYSWSTGESSPTIEVSQSGWYSVVVKNQAGCESSKSFYISTGDEPIESPQKWVRLNPTPTSLAGNDIYFVNENIGFIVNDKELLKTDNQGKTWTKVMSVDKGKRISFVDGYGYIVGAGGSIYKSTYHGGGWNKLETSFSENFNSITLLHPDTVLITSDYKLFKSFDGGDTWQTLEINGVNVEDAHFINHLVGHVACTNGTILKTTNGGVSWYETETSNIIPSNFFRITFVNDTLGFATQEHDDLYKTTDGGESWNEVVSSVDAGYALQFIDEQIGFMAGEHGAIHKTVDGGKSWNWIGFDGRRYANDIYAIHFINEQLGFATGLRGRIIKTTNGGRSWEEYNLIYNTVDQLQFVSENVGYMEVGSAYYKSINGGLSWEPISPPAHYEYANGFQFVNEQIGYSIGGGTLSVSGSVFKTTDGGLNWTKLGITVDEGLSSLYFINEDIGFISGGFNRRTLMKTTDGGNSWKQVGTEEFGQIQFLNTQVGYANRIGYSIGRMYKTLDGGESWDIAFENEEGINAFHFVNESVGYIVGDNALIYKTMNGGDSWQKLNIPYEWYEEVRFYSENLGFIADEEGTVYKTLDGGINWDKVNELSGIQNINFINNVVYASGVNGSVLKSTVTLADQVKFGLPQLREVRNTTATITGELISKLNNIEVYFEIGLTDSNLKTLPYEGLSGNSYSELVMPLTELEEGTTYYCRFKAVQGDEVAYSQITSFTTWTYEDLLIISDVKVTPVSNESAIIEFKVDSYLASMELYADIGLASNTYSRQDLIGKFPTDFRESLRFNLGNLSKETVYFLRIRAKDGEKNIFGNEISFSTANVLNVKESFAEISIYPNPTTNILRFDNVQNLTESFVLDSSGKTLLHNISGQKFVDLSALPPGSYFLVLLHDDRRTAVRVIKR